MIVKRRCGGITFSPLDGEMKAPFLDQTAINADILYILTWARYMETFGHVPIWGLFVTMLTILHKLLIFIHKYHRSLATPPASSYPTPAIRLPMRARRLPKSLTQPKRASATMAFLPLPPTMYGNSVCRFKAQWESTLETFAAPLRAKRVDKLEPALPGLGAT
jgi:hypothetical protein